MTSNLRMILTVALVFTVCFITSIANASGFPSLTVRVDHNTVDAELGACAEGRRIVVVTAGRTHWSGYGASDLTVDPIRPDMATMRRPSAQEPSSASTVL